MKKGIAERRSWWRRAGRFLGYHAGEAIVWFFMIGVAVFEIAPISWLFSTSLVEPAHSFDLPPKFFPTAFHWENYLAVLNSTEIDFVRFFWNSLRVAATVTGAQLLTCSMAGFAFARLRFPGRAPLFFLFLASMMVPFQVVMIPTFIIIRVLGMMDTHWSLILPSATSAFGIFLMRQQFMTLPEELMEAARMDGASFLRVYAQILLPLVGPGLSALAVLTFLASWNSFMAPLLFIRTWERFTLPLALVQLKGYMGMGNRAHVLAGVMMSVFPLMVLFLLAQRHILQGISTTGLKY